MRLARFVQLAKEVRSMRGDVEFRHTFDKRGTSIYTPKRVLEDHEPEVEVDFAVDDDASVVESYGGYCVGPFGGTRGTRSS